MALPHRMPMALPHRMQVKLSMRVAAARKRQKGAQKGAARMMLPTVYLPEETSPNTTTVSGTALWEGRVMQRATWTIQSRDRYDNRTSEPHTSFAVLVAHVPAPTEASETMAETDAAENNDVSLTMSSTKLGNSTKTGDVSVTWLFRRSGTYRVHVSLHGVTLRCSPLTCTVAQPVAARPGALPGALSGIVERRDADNRQKRADRMASHGLPWREEHMNVWYARPDGA